MNLLVVVPAKGGGGHAVRQFDAQQVLIASEAQVEDADAQARASEASLVPGVGADDGHAFSRDGATIVDALLGQPHADDVLQFGELIEDGAGLVRLQLSLDQFQRHGNVDPVAVGADDGGAGGLQLGHQGSVVFRIEDEGDADIAFGSEQAALAGQFQRRLLASLLVGQKELLVDGVQFRVGEDGGQFGVLFSQVGQGGGRGDVQGRQRGEGGSGCDGRCGQAARRRREIEDTGCQEQYGSHDK